ncbi:PAS domain S-box protein [Limnothrix sp. FACHB-708]|uniref:adenylate/guanylate cyclase domain-containing protein n=1 Tax=unclassified Limnothrix TaxID=2632864 RepID=UPI001684D4F9|nr:PAS domain S-box protein [Limnothrix sp. FACHB-708]MBD2592450.1 PAS domain S-box protein [Limnothrix sp. FACHB-406]
MTFSIDPSAESLPDGAERPVLRPDWSVARSSLLIVDDRTDDRTLLHRLLAREGYHILLADNAHQAWQQLKHHTFDLILLDVYLPDRSGFALCEELKANPKTADIPIIFTGSSDGGSNGNLDKIQAFKVGGVDYLIKPFALEEVLVRVNTHLKIQRAAKLVAEQNQRLIAEVAEHEKTAAILQEQKQYLRIILDNIPQQIFWKNADLVFLGCNRSWAEASGLGDPESVIGKTDQDLIEDPAIAEQFRAQDRRVIETNQPISHQLLRKYRHAEGGQPIWLDCYRVPIRDEAGQVIGVLGVLDDITDRKLAADALQQAEENYRSIFENALEGIFQATWEGRFMSVNPTLARICGYGSPQEMMELITNVGQQLYVRSHRREEFLAYMAQYGEVSNFESEVYRKDGRRIWISETVRSVYDAGGKFLYFEGMVQEITERRKTELELRQQRQQSEQLLLNILPQKIAQRLKMQQTAMADRFESATVLFADIVGFTEWASQIQAAELVSCLNDIFSEFDRIAERYGVEKIKTIGDAYMAVGGVPSAHPNHAINTARMALEMQQAIGQFQRKNGQTFQLRIGLNTGPLVAGVIGIRKFIYDLWGDTVNIASRMESQGEAAKIQVTASTAALLGDQFVLEPRGPWQVRGRGEMLTYWLVGERPPVPDPDFAERAGEIADDPRMNHLNNFRDSNPGDFDPDRAAGSDHPADDRPVAGSQRGDFDPEVDPKDLNSIDHNGQTPTHPARSGAGHAVDRATDAHS